MKNTSTAFCGLISGLLAMAAITSTANAAVTMTAIESAGDVVVTGSGTLNLTAVTYSSNAGHSPGFDPTDGYVMVGQIGGDYYSGVSGPSAIGLGPISFASANSGDHFGILGGGNFVAVPFGYLSEDPLSGSATYSGETISSLGLTPGTYVWTWGSGGTADSFTLNVVPEASSALLSFVAIAVVGLRRRRA